MRILYSYTSVLVVALLAFGIFISSIYAAPAENLAWTQYNDGLSGGNILGLVYHPSDPNTAYALTTAAGVYKTTNAGTSWSTVNTGLPSDKSIAFPTANGDYLNIDPQDGDTLYVSIGGTLHQTTDGGVNWSDIHNDIDGCTPNSVAGARVDPQDSNLVYAGHQAAGCIGGLYKSINKGSNWTRISASPDNDTYPIVLDPSDQNTFYIGTFHSGLYKTTNGGTTFTDITPSGFTNDITAEIAMHPTTTSRIFVSDREQNLYISEDQGSTWGIAPGTSGKGFYAIEFASSSPAVGYAVGETTGIYKSTDSGQTWSEVGSHSGISARSITIDPSDADTFLVGTVGGGVYKSTNGGTTIAQVNSGIPIEIKANAIAIAPSDANTYYAALNGQGFYVSSDRGYTWNLANNSVGNVINNAGYIIINPADKDHIITGTDPIYESTDGGENWSVLYDFPGSDTISYGIASRSSFDTLIVSNNTEQFFYYSTDGGTTFATSTSASVSNSIVQIVQDIEDSDYLYAASANYIWKSSDEGVTWTQDVEGSNNFVESIVTDPTNTGHAYFGNRADELLFTDDFGATWSLVSNFDSDVASDNPIGLRIDSEGTLYSFGFSGWNKSTDGGSTWTSGTKNGFSGFFNPRPNLRIDPLNSNRFIVSEFFTNGIYIFEDYVTSVASSTITLTDDNGGSTQSGETYTYTISIENNGTRDADDVTITMILPNDTDYVSGSATVDNASEANPITEVRSGDTITITLGSLEKDETVTVTFKAIINQDTGDHFATITTDDDTSGILIGPVSVDIVGASSGLAQKEPETESGSSDSTSTNNDTESEEEESESQDEDTSSIPLATETSELEEVTACPFSEYHRIGDTGPGVTQIQEFLTNQDHYSGPLTGIFDQTTFNAVEAFQNSFTDLVLLPWEENAPTGYWYKTTRKQANKLLGCNEGSVFLEGIGLFD